MPPSPEDHTAAGVHVDGRPWRAIDNLDAAGPNDEVFAFDADTATVRFGDGVHGKRPPNGALVSVTFRSGGDRQSVVSVASRWPPAGESYELSVHADRVVLRASGGRVHSFTGVKRVRFFTGRLLSADDLNEEQRYLNQKRHLHNRALHGVGVVTGLAVSLSSTDSPGVTVSPGLALDPRGREVLVAAALSLPIAAATSPLYVVLDYCERPTDPAPLAGGISEPTRIEEGAALRLAGEGQIGDGIALARLLRTAAVWELDTTFARPICRAGP